MVRIKIMNEVFTWIGSALAGIFIALIISAFLFQPTKVVGSSMDPTLEDSYRIFISKLPRITNYNPEYGDIVIIDSRVDRPRHWKDDILDSPLIKFFSSGEDDHYIWVKRVIGKPGDVLEYHEGKVWRNGKKLEEPYVKEEMQFPFERTVVPKDTIYVMGDNRNCSKDSRVIGPIPIKNVLGTKITFSF
jgi:signal peptidase I